MLARSGCMLALAVVLAAGIAGFGLARDALDRAITARAAAISIPTTGREVVDREGRLLMAFTAPDERWRLALGQGSAIDRRYLAILLAWEDRRFRTHGGVDPLAVTRAMAQAARHGRIVSGASTLTMQAARLVSRLPPGTWAAKREQVLTALALERTRAKDDILRLYLTLAPFGGNIEGVRAASLAWFGKDVSVGGQDMARLTAAEAALLVALPQSPERLRPDRHPDRAQRARDRVLRRAFDQGVIDRGTLARALAEPLPRRRLPLPALAPHVAVRLAATDESARIETTIDRTAQVALEALARKAVAGEVAGPFGARTSLAIVAIDRRDGRIVASVGGPHRFARARDGHVDLTRAVRSPGSALKPFVYGLAFDRGLAHPDSIVSDRPASFAGYRPANFDRAFEGDTSVRRALQTSRNLPAVELMAMVGPQRFVSRLEHAGVPLRMRGTKRPGLALALGGAGLTLTELTGLYAALADGGRAWTPAVTPAEADGEPRRFLSERASWYLTSILARGGATRARVAGRIAFKTGTSYGYRDAWAVGYDGRHTIGVWVGRPDGAPVSGLSGDGTGVPILFDAFARLGPTHVFDRVPPDAILAGGALPRALGRIGRAARDTARDGPQIAFPPDGAEIEMAGSGKGQFGGAVLPLKVTRGAAPFTWFVDGRPVARRVFLREAWHRVAEPGFLRVSVVDAAGRAAHVRIRAR